MEQVRTCKDSAEKTGIRYVECPHCHHEVMERPDGRCIACGKNHHDTSETNPHLTMVTIENVSRLPPNCFLCGVQTGRIQKFSWNYRVDPNTLPPWMIPFVKLMSYVPGSQYRSTERLVLPTCSDCRRAAKRVRPLSVWSGLDCRLLVHRVFRERFEALNGKARLEWEAEKPVSSSQQSKNGKDYFSGVGMRL